MPQSRQPSFVPTLESLRGIAALFVAIFHSFVWMPVKDQPVSIMSIFDVHGIQPLLARIIIAITNGTTWVYIFFILSGYVLSLSTRDKKLSFLNWAEFIGKRVTRIAPAYLAALLTICCTLILRATTKGLSDAYDWYPAWNSSNLTPSDIFLNVIFLETWLNPPAWTLQVEIWVAAIFPFLVLLNKNTSIRLATAVISAILILEYLSPKSLVLKQASTACLFFVGIMAYRHGASAITKIPDSYLPYCLIASLLIIITPNFFHITNPSLREAPTAIGGFFMISIISSGRRCRGTTWLKSSSVRFLGKISFSFYLLHYMSLYLTTSVFSHYFGFNMLNTSPLLVAFGSALISITICLIPSWALYNFVEAPCVNLGKKIFDRRSSESIIPITR